MRGRVTTRRSRSARQAPLARYSNYFEVGHNACEFLFDFGQFQPEAAGVLLFTRIAMCPTHAKLLNETLGGAVAQYESDNGTITPIRDPLDPMEVVLRSLPDFERRAASARRQHATELEAGLPKRRTPKR